MQAAHFLDRNKRKTWHNQVNQILESGYVRSQNNRREYMRRSMDPYEARSVCDDRVVWKYILFAYPMMHLLSIIMTFCVDVVSEDSFYENLILGVIKLLELNPRVSKIAVERKMPADRGVLTSWEQRHSVTLPDDIRHFYLSTDGFTLKWSYQYSQDDILSVGLININSLCDLTLSPGLKELIDQANNKTQINEKRPIIGPKSKIFEIDDCKGKGKACLVFTDNKWTIWLLDNEGTWTWLADSFIYYFRMALVHQGIPGWQAVFTASGPIPWSEQLFLLMAPHLLEEAGEPKRLQGCMNDAPLNHIDPGIFKTSPKNINKGASSKH